MWWYLGGGVSLGSGAQGGGHALRAGCGAGQSCTGGESRSRRSRRRVPQPSRCDVGFACCSVMLEPVSHCCLLLVSFKFRSLFKPLCDICGCHTGSPPTNQEGCGPRCPRACSRRPSAPSGIQSSAPPDHQLRPAVQPWSLRPLSPRRRPKCPLRCIWLSG